MRPQTTKKLNPFAPEYQPIPAGVTPSPHASLPLFFSTACRRPQSSPFLLPQQILSSSHKTQHQFHPTTYSTYHANPQNRNGQPGRRGRGRGRGFVRYRRVFGREREITTFSPSKHQQFSKRGMHKLEDRHQIVPLKRDEQITTVMIKNIPYNCPRKKLITMLDKFCLLENQKARNEATSGEEELLPYAYDFLYLPIDFGTKRSRGFAFVNFTSSRAVWSFYDSIHLTNWDFLDRMKWQKRIEIVTAKIQGKEELLRHFSVSFFECGTDEYLPVCFTPARDGSGQPVELTVVGNRRPTARW